jgi:signal transduction histidine kinase
MAAVTHRRRAVVRTVPRGPSEVEVEVEDTGPGIAVEPVSRIFDPFFTTKHDGRSLGLGLAIARSIVEAHRGQVFARNNPGGGASVGFVLPAGAVALP